MKTIQYSLIFVACFVFNYPLNAKEITVKVVDIENMPLANMVVYILPLEAQSFEKYSREPLVISQADQKFKPYISVIQKGLPVSFENEDDITHQIYSSSASNRFSFRIQSGKQQSIEPLMNTGKILMACNIHDWMGGYLLVLDTPLYAKTSEAGVANIDVPENGKYQISVWHPQLMQENQTITKIVNVNDNSDFKVKLSKKMAEIPSQENPVNSDFIEDY